MARFKLLLGQHIQEDPKAVPGPDGRRPSRTYTQGQIIESDVDLVDKFGPGKFEMVGEAEKEREQLRKDRQQARKASAPHGTKGAHVEESEAEITTARGAYLTRGRLPGDPPPELSRKVPSVAPGGQVSSGFQQTTGGADGRSISGPVSSEDNEESARILRETATEQQKASFSPATTHEEEEARRERQVEQQKAQSAVGLPGAKPQEVQGGKKPGASPVAVPKKGKDVHHSSSPKDFVEKKASGSKATGSSATKPKFKAKKH